MYVQITAYMFAINNRLINGDPGIMNSYKEGLISWFLLPVSLGSNYYNVMYTTQCVCVVLAQCQA